MENAQKFKTIGLNYLLLFLIMGSMLAWEDIVSKGFQLTKVLSILGFAFVVAVCCSVAEILYQKHQAKQAAETSESNDEDIKFLPSSLKIPIIGFYLIGVSGLLITHGFMWQRLMIFTLGAAAIGFVFLTIDKYVLKKEVA
ncbi:hypothetical protein [Vagococcus silagei]|uniref:Uncharacterized protein n=1 Tax=Vagococcus silagei TaxID=2508885 RepID=A0A4S3B6X6_9ENTE|nr:hypothetical protein [Vagococcus silagei]THB62418.1 hypothetical protein ESZ54_00990 [Vagococcus silagei]